MWNKQPYFPFPISLLSVFQFSSVFEVKLFFSVYLKKRDSLRLDKSCSFCVWVLCCSAFIALPPKIVLVCHCSLDCQLIYIRFSEAWKLTLFHPLHSCMKCLFKYKEKKPDWFYGSLVEGTTICALVNRYQCLIKLILNWKTTEMKILPLTAAICLNSGLIFYLSS